MVKADIKHNYYADLELPTTCSIDDIKKQYRKLALLYHPDRNAGKEEEYVPKFQAIQIAHEVLGDPVQKAKYDADRRKAGLYPEMRAATQPTTGNPYTATSSYPPPPRRTQPGQWQRPQQTPPAASAAPGPAPGPAPAPSGADRFSNFPRGAPTARKDPAQDRTNMFRAWQNMNNPQERQSQPQPQPPPQPAARGPVPPTPSRPRPPPRNDTKMPSEEEIRAGMNYRKPPPQHDGVRPEERPSAWSAFQQANAGKPGMTRSGTTRTPKKQGFDPNAPGSDERPAGGWNYGHRHRSEDFGMPGSGAPFPPPPPGPPPQSPLSPSASTSSSRPYADPLRAFKSREGHDPQVPFTEGDRRRTPYSTSSGVGEKTEVLSEGLRRSNSTRDATKLHAQDGGNGRARSTSPLGRHQTTKGHQPRESGRKPFVDYSSSESSDDDRSTSQTPEGEAPTSVPAGRPQSASHAERPKRFPTPPSKRFNGATSAFSPPPNADGAQSETEAPGMRQKTNNNNMYASFPDYVKHNVLNESPFAPGNWAAHAFGAYSTYATEAQRDHHSIPNWAVPSSVLPLKRKVGKANEAPASCAKTTARTAHENTVPVSSEVHPKTISEEQRAYNFFRSELQRAHGEVPTNFDMDVFRQLTSTVRRGGSSGNGILDNITQRTLSLYTLNCLSSDMHSQYADKRSHDHSFTFPVDHELFAPNSKSKSEEQIDTKFSPEGWHGAFTGASGYFAPPPPQSSRKAPSPPRRGSQRSGLRSATTHVPSSATTPTDMPSPRRAFGSDGQHNLQPEPTPSEVKFSTEQWQKTFKDASWTYPTLPPTAPSPSKAKSGAPPPPLVDEPDAMDIDSTPTPADKPILDDLAHVEPIARSTTNEGLDNLADISSTLPFKSQASGTLPRDDDPAHHKLQMPPVPKAPEPPTKLTPDSFHAHAENFALYLQAYHTFNKTMLAHFEAREAQTQAQARMAGGDHSAWLRAVGDMTSKGEGWGSYVGRVREDEKVRETWTLGCERHVEACGRFEGLRERMKKAVGAGGV